MQKIGIFGGTFDPIHNGHLHIAEEFIRRLQLHTLLLVPTGISPHKGKAAASAADRLYMCELAAKETGLPLSVCPWEAMADSVSFTADTLQKVRSLYPQAELWLLLGEDKFFSLPNWVRAEEILSLCGVAVAPRSKEGVAALRQQMQCLRQKFPQAQCRIEDISFWEISSSLVREKLQNGEDASSFLPESVNAYIRQKGLYKAGN